MGQCSGSRARFTGPEDALYSCVTTLTHRSSVSGLCVLSNGRLVSSTEDSVQLWTLEPVIVYKEIEAVGCVSLCALAGDQGQIAATTHADIKILDLETSKVLRNIEERAVSLCPVSDNLLAVGVEKEHGGVIQIVDLRSDTYAQTLRGHENHVRAIVTPREHYLISGSHDRTIKVWDLKTSTATRTLTGHEEPVVALTLLVDGRLASGSFDTTIRLWDPWTGAQTGQLPGHSESVNSLCVTGDQKLVSASDDKTIKIWNVGSRASVTLTGHDSFVHQVCALEVDQIASASNDRTVKIWSPRNDVELKREGSMIIETKHTDVEDEEKLKQRQSINATYARPPPPEPEDLSKPRIRAPSLPPPPPPPRKSSDAPPLLQF